jgi:hypothetical protein
MGGACGSYAYKKQFDTDTEVKRPLAKLGRRWKSNMKADLTALGWKGAD